MAYYNTDWRHEEKRIQSKEVLARKEFGLRSDRVDDEGEKGELLGKIPRYTYLTLTPPIT